MVEIFPYKECERYFELRSLTAWSRKTIGNFSIRRNRQSLLYVAILRMPPHATWLVTPMAVADIIGAGKISLRQPCTLFNR
jgi:hypothetical protein